MAEKERKEPTLYRGIVSSKSGDKTVKVLLNYMMRHPKYGKSLRRRTIAHAHDEKNEAVVGDTVDICKCRRLSATKSWRLVNIVKN